MPLKDSQNHQLVWFDLMEEVANPSWFSVIPHIYAKDGTFSNYKKCKERDHKGIREDVYSDKKIKQYLDADPGNKQKIDKILDEMCHLAPIQTAPIRWTRIVGGILLKYIKRIYSHIYINNHLYAPSDEQQLMGFPSVFKEQFLSMSQELPVLILPTHRSYMDFMLISYILFDRELPQPIIATGDNFKSLGPLMTNLIKKLGSFLIRRDAYNRKDIDATVYYDILRAYTHSLIEGGENPLEFFMEGGRTRTGQVLCPKTGLLSMVVDLYIDQIVEDIYIMPTSINYQRPVEEQLLIAESSAEIGKEKPKESTYNLMTGLETIAKRNYGDIYVRFIEPFKLSDYFLEWKKATNTKSADNGNRKTVLHDFTISLASKICLSQAQNNILMPINLLATSLLARTFFNQRAINGDYYTYGFQLDNRTFKIPIVDIMKDFCDIEELLINTQPQFVPGWKRHIELLDDFNLDRDGIIKSDKERKNVEIDCNTVTFNTLLYYSNQVTQVLLPIAICSLLTDQCFQGKSEISLRDQFKGIRLVLSKEFLVHDISLRSEFENSLLAIEKKQVPEETKSIIKKHLSYFVQSYSIFFNYLLENEKLNQVDFFNFKSNNQKLNNFIISKDMLKNMINLVKELGICVKDIPKDNNQDLNKSNNREQIIVNNKGKLVELTEQFQQVLKICEANNAI